MPRELFPHDDDKRVIQTFLAADQRQRDYALLLASDRMSIQKGKLYLDGGATAWFDTGGALTMKLGGSFPLTLFRVANYINELLGVTDGCMSVVRANDGDLHWYAGDREISIEDPFVVAGPLSIQAYRASLGS